MVPTFSKIRRLREDAQALWEERMLQRGEKPSGVKKFLHFWVLVWKSFNRNRCLIRASALAYVTLLALIPMLAIVVSVTSAFLKKQGEEQINQFIEKMVANVTPPAMLTTNLVTQQTDTTVADPNADTSIWDEFEIGSEPPDSSTDQPAVVDSHTTVTVKKAVRPSFMQNEDAVQARKTVASHIYQFIQKTRSGALGLTGTVLLIFTAISMLSRIEATFNDIWGVAKGRGWFMRIVLYWGVISLAPILLVVAIGLASGPYMHDTRLLIDSMPFIGTFVFRLLPVAVLCLTFTVFYILIPNAKVQWQAAAAGGFVAGLLLHLNSAFSVLYVSRVAANSRLYGSLGLVPVFMIGLYFAWLIMLFGAQVAYAYQNRATYLEEKQVENINQRGREFVALRLLTYVGQRFIKGMPPPTIVELSENLAIPTRLIRQVMQTLAAARLAVETSIGETAYLPARPLENITCHDVLVAMRATQGQELATREEPSRAEVLGEFCRIQEAERQAAASVTLLRLVQRAEALEVAAREPERLAQNISAQA